jgi:hypothetical protein
LVYQDNGFFRYSKKKGCPPNIWSSPLIKHNIAALHAVKSAQINFAVVNAKSNGGKSPLSVQDAGSFFSGTFTNYWLTTAIIAILSFVAEIAKADGLENITGLNHIPIIQVQW